VPAAATGRPLAFYLRGPGGKGALSLEARGPPLSPFPRAESPAQTTPTLWRKRCAGRVVL